MKYHVGKLLTREYYKWERRILQTRIIRSTDDWGSVVRFICKDGSYGYRRINSDEEFEIQRFIQWIRLAPYCMDLRYLWVLPDDSRLDMLTSLYLYNAYDGSAEIRRLANKYKWLYDTETWENEK